MTSGAAPRVGLYDDPLYREHDSGPGHPERPARLDAVRRGLREAGLEASLELCTPPPATDEQLLRVHTEAHLAAVDGTRGRTVRFDADTQAGPRSSEAARLAAGAVTAAVDAVLAGSLQRAFCAVRPPGHHAEAERAMGFCLFNNVAVGAAHALASGLTRVAVIDWDVHHGNGTQAAFWRDPRVLYVSTHAYPFYPGTGALAEVGEGDGRGYTVNLPFPFAAGDAEYTAVYRRVVAPVVSEFDPELVLVSVGFDPHRDDPLAPMRVTERGFGSMAAACLSAAAGAAGGRAVFVLEGGYDLEGIASSSAAVARRILGKPAAEGPAAEAGASIEPLFEAYRRELRGYWRAL
jgi:acetoin utilization deacetylase AcuC-like enzyme